MALQMILFDLDNTIYPASNGLMKSIDRRIGEFLEQRLGLDEEQALALRRSYYQEFGTTLRGLRHHHSEIETESYLEYVHTLAIEAFLVSDKHLGELLDALPLRKAIFTNSPVEHAERVLETLGLAQSFERIFDIRFCEFVGKPDPQSYHRVLDALDMEGQDVIFVEDTAHNLVPAAQLGMTTILISGDLTVSPLADYVVPDVVAAVDLIRRLLIEKPALVDTNSRSAQI